MAPFSIERSRGHSGSEFSSATPTTSAVRVRIQATINSLLLCPTDYTTLQVRTPPIMGQRRMKAMVVARNAGKSMSVSWIEQSRHVHICRGCCVGMGAATRASAVPRLRVDSSLSRS
jgi:hypothetical protein